MEFKSMYLAFIILCWIYFVCAQDEICYRCECDQEEREIVCRGLNPDFLYSPTNNLYEKLDFRLCDIEVYREETYIPYMSLKLLDIRRVDIDCGSIPINPNFTILSDCAKISSTTDTTFISYTSKEDKDSTSSYSTDTLSSKKTTTTKFTPSPMTSKETTKSASTTIEMDHSTSETFASTKLTLSTTFSHPSTKSENSIEPTTSSQMTIWTSGITSIPTVSNEETKSISVSILTTDLMSTVSTPKNNVSATNQNLEIILSIFGVFVFVTMGIIFLIWLWKKKKGARIPHSGSLAPLDLEDLWDVEMEEFSV